MSTNEATTIIMIWLFSVIGAVILKTPLIFVAPAMVTSIWIIVKH